MVPAPPAPKKGKDNKSRDGKSNDGRSDDGHTDNGVSGNVYFVAANQPCRQRDVRYTWNIEGERGPEGLPGRPAHRASRVRRAWREPRVLWGPRRPYR